MTTPGPCGKLQVDFGVRIDDQRLFEDSFRPLAILWILCGDDDAAEGLEAADVNGGAALGAHLKAVVDVSKRLIEIEIEISVLGAFNKEVHAFVGLSVCANAKQRDGEEGESFFQHGTKRLYQRAV